jgi:hypothetical protein
MVARRADQEGPSGEAVVKPASAAPKAATQLSAPLAAPSQKSSSTAVRIALGTIVALVAAIGIALAFPKQKPDTSPPLKPTATQRSSGTPPAPATAAIAAPEAAVEDAPDDAVIESPTRPAGCSADRPICECCRSGRDCAPGHCDDDLKPEEGWHLRFGKAEIDGSEIGKDANVEVCTRIARPGDRISCTKMSALDAPNAKLLFANGVELQGFGIEIELRTPGDAGAHTLRAKLKRDLTRIALCQGIEIDQFSAAESGSAVNAKLLVFLDEPGAPPERCSQ